MPVVVQVLWGALLLAVVALLPFIVAGLHRAWLASRKIDYYFGEMLTAAEGIAGNTVEIRQLDGTIGGATTLLETAVAIDEKAETIRATLGARADSQSTSNESRGPTGGQP